MNKVDMHKLRQTMGASIVWPGSRECCHLIGKINEAAIVGCGGGLSKAHVDQVGFVLQNCDESPGETSPGLHSTKARVPNLA